MASNGAFAGGSLADLAASQMLCMPQSAGYMLAYGSIMLLARLDMLPGCWIVRTEVHGSDAHCCRGLSTGWQRLSRLA